MKLMQKMFLLGFNFSLYYFLFLLINTKYSNFFINLMNPFGEVIHFHMFVESLYSLPTDLKYLFFSLVKICVLL